MSTDERTGNRFLIIQKTWLSCLCVCVFDATGKADFSYEFSWNWNWNKDKFNAIWSKFKWNLDSCYFALHCIWNELFDDDIFTNQRHFSSNLKATFENQQKHFKAWMCVCECCAYYFCLIKNERNFSHPNPRIDKTQLKWMEENLPENYLRFIWKVFNRESFINKYPVRVLSFNRV